MGSDYLTVMEFLLGMMKLFWNSIVVTVVQCCFLKNNNNNKLYTSKRQILCYVNYISKKKKKLNGCLMSWLHMRAAFTLTQIYNTESSSGSIHSSTLNACKMHRIQIHFITHINQYTSSCSVCVPI